MFSQKSEGQIWKEFKLGNLHAYEYIYRTYVPILYNYGYKISQDKSLVQDCIQEIFITLLLKRESLSESDSIKFYLFKALRRRIIRELEIRDKFIPFEGELEFNALFSTDSQYVDQVITPEQSLQLLTVLNSLPARQKEAITLRFYDNLSYEQIAKIMDIETSSAYKIIYKAIENLHKKMSLEIIVIYYLLLQKQYLR